ncbi:MAG: HD domain-containing phosphohydrolase [Vulcanimicrobiaceae bacterium]
MAISSRRTLAPRVGELLNTLARIVDVQDGGAALHHVVTHLPEILDVDRVFIYQLSTDRKRLIVTHESGGTRESLLGLSQPIAQLPAITQQAVRTGKQVYIDDLATFPVTGRQRRSLRFSNVVSTIMTPFGVQRRFAGILVVDVFETRRVWEQDAVDGCARIAGALGTILGRSQRGAHLPSNAPALETASAQLSVLRNLSLALADAPGAVAIVSGVLDELGNLYGRDAVEITLRDGGTNVDGPSREALTVGEPLVRRDAGGMRYVVPIHGDGEPLGVIDVRSQTQLDTEHARFLDAVGRIAGNALAHAARLEALQRDDRNDVLTGVLNHRTLLEQYSERFAQCKAARRTFSALLVDVDSLRLLNAKYGYAVGDEILRYVARQVAHAAQEKGFAGRFGPEEFLLALPDVASDEAERLASTLLERVAGEVPADLPATSISIGVASAPHTTTQADVLLDQLEKAVFVAKYGGRNRVQAVAKNPGASWERLAMEALFAVLTAKQFVTGPQAVEKAAERLAQAGSRNLDMALALAQAVDVRDKYTSGHSHAVANYAVKLARGLHLDEGEIEEVRLGALLHDVGKIGTPEHILGKNGPLTDDEFAVMRKHPEDGARILAPIPSMRRVAGIVEAHQEYWDGSGYPHGLSGESIPPAARIVSIGDAYHAMVSTRPYRKGMSSSQAGQILTNGGGKQWDSRFLETFVNIVIGR